MGAYSILKFHETRIPDGKSLTSGSMIEYTTGGVTRNVVSTSENEIVLTDLSPMSTYIISVYSYTDLLSVNCP